nr:hypothetical protein [Tanacetum cinerariifolium]
MVESQLAEEEVRGLELGDDGTKTLKGPTEPILQTQTTPSPSPAFVKKNINVLRTIIKEHDHQTKKKATPRKLVYANSERKAPDGSGVTRRTPERLVCRRTDQVRSHQPCPSATMYSSYVSYLDVPRETIPHYGANNNLIVLNHSPLFDDLLDDIATVVPYEVNGVTFEKGNEDGDNESPNCEIENEDSINL